MLNTISQALRKVQPTAPSGHGRVVLLLLFAFIFSGWMVFGEVGNLVQAAHSDLHNQLAIEVTLE